MKNILVRIMSLLVVVGLLVGCGTDNNNELATQPANNETEETNNNLSAEEAEQTVSITISKDEEAEIIVEKEIEIEENDLLMDVMKENFDIEEEDGFIHSIEGIAPLEDEEKAWMYFVNGEMAMVGAAEYELSPGDEVSFDLQAWE